MDEEKKGQNHTNQLSFGDSFIEKKISKDNSANRIEVRD